MTSLYDYTILFGRMQGFTPAHHNIIKTALIKSHKLILILGCTNSGRTLRDPFTASERARVIRDTFSLADNERIIITTLHDHKYNDNRWLADAQSTIKGSMISHFGDNPRVALIGHAKDSSSYYLKMFPEYDSIDVPSLKAKDGSNLDATNMRIEMYNYVDTPLTRESKYYINDGQLDAINRLMLSKDLELVHEEYHWIQNYKKEWGFNGQWNTTDACVTIGGHVLLIQRGNFPSKGQWALPGGFLNPKERIKTAVVRELREETKLKVPEPVLWGSMAKHDTYDDPDRDPRGRLITHAYHFDMKNYGVSDPDKIKLPKIMGADDAIKAKWFTFAEVKAMRHMMCSDHYDIIEDLVGIL